VHQPDSKGTRAHSRSVARYCHHRGIATRSVRARDPFERCTVLCRPKQARTGTSARDVGCSPDVQRRIVPCASPNAAATSATLMPAARRSTIHCGSLLQLRPKAPPSPRFHRFEPRRNFSVSRWNMASPPRTTPARKAIPVTTVQRETLRDRLVLHTARYNLRRGRVAAWRAAASASSRWESASSVAFPSSSSSSNSHSSLKTF
jgi:hypothetical protein